MLLTGNQKWKKLYALCNKFAKGKIFILCDTNSFSLCLPIVLNKLKMLKDAEVIIIPAGEKNKVLNTVEFITQALLIKKCDRNSLLINVGGGVVTDIGGFAASVYMRGIPFVNIPTTLMAMTDASHGGKTGIDFQNVKNILGTFANPKAVIIEERFLNTLPVEELYSGFAEMLKHGLIKSKVFYTELLNNGPDNLKGMIEKSVKIKYAIVTKDPVEKGVRKILNLGHTIGHAIESYLLKKNKQPLPHGYAVAYGIIAEAHIAYKKGMLPESIFKKISADLSKIYGSYHIKKRGIDLLLELMTHDKKNETGKIKMVLLKTIGKPVYDVEVNTSEIKDALHFLSTLIPAV